MAKKQIFITYLSGILLCCISMLHFTFWETKSFKMGDAWGYYAYLPATFIHHDLDNLDSSHIIRSKYAGLQLLAKDNPLYYGEALIGSRGKPVIKYTYGVSLLESPFFFIGHCVAKITGYKQDGYSLPYSIMLHIGNFLYILTGLLLLYSILTKWFSNAISLATVLIIGLATNLLYFTLFNTGMVHGYLFFLYACLLYSTIRFYENATLGKFIVMAFISTLITVIRPTEILCLIIPLLYGCGTIKDVKERIAFLRSKWRWLLVAAITALFVALPQFIYWKTQTGFWLYDSYPTEHFNFFKPEILNGFFSFKNGWLIYTPVMFLALFGLFFIRRKIPELLFAITIIFVLHVYIIYSWWSWQYVNGYGSRPMVQLYTILAFALAAFLNWLWSNKWYIKTATVVFIVACGVINIIHLFQCQAGTLLTEDGTWNLYKTSFAKFTTTRAMVYAYDNNLPYCDTVQKQKIKTIAVAGFEDSTFSSTDTIHAFSGTKSQHLTNQEFGVNFKLKASEYGIEKGMFVHFKAWMWLPENHGLYDNVLMVINEELDGKTTSWNSIRMENKYPDTGGYSFWWGKQQTWVPVDFTVEIMQDVNPNTIFVCSIWNPRKKEIFIDDASVSLWVNRKQ